MSAWHNEYLATLQLRDRREKAGQTTYESYTKLADRAANLNKTSETESVHFTVRKLDGDGLRLPNPSQPMVIAQIREDLLEAQRSRGDLQSRLTLLNSNLAKLQSKSKLESQRINELLTDKQNLTTKLRDRDEELRGKTKLLEDVHDETVSLTLQLNMAEAQSDRLHTENKELVDRWMARMGQEAEAMNSASKFS